MSTQMEKRFFRVLKIGVLLWGCFILWDEYDDTFLVSKITQATLHCQDKIQTIQSHQYSNEIENTYINTCLSETEILALLEKSLPEYATLKQNYTSSQMTDLVAKIKENPYQFLGYDTMSMLMDNLVTSGVVSIDYERQKIEWDDIGFALIVFISVFILSPLILEKIVWKYIRDGKILDKKRKFFIF